MTLRSMLLASLLLASSWPLWGVESSDLRYVDSETLWQKSELISTDLQALLNRQDLTLGELQTGVLALTKEFSALKEDFETWKTSLEGLKEQSATLRMESAKLESTMTTLGSRLDSLSASLTSLEDDMRKAQNRATVAMVGGITAVVAVIAGCVYVYYKTR